MTRSYTVSEFMNMESKETNNIKLIATIVTTLLLTSTIEILAAAEKVVEAVEWF